MVAAEEGVYPADKARVGAPVLQERVPEPGLPGRPHVGEDIGPAEAVDRLLRVPDQEKGGRIPDRIDAVEDGELGRVGILELVDERGPVAVADQLGERRTFAAQRLV